MGAKKHNVDHACPVSAHLKNVQDTCSKEMCRGIMSFEPPGGNKYKSSPGARRPRWERDLQAVAEHFSEPLAWPNFPQTLHMWDFLCGPFLPLKAGHARPALAADRSAKAAGWASDLGRGSAWQWS